MHMPARLLLMLALASLSVYGADSPVSHLVGHYSDEQLSGVRTLILPRMYLYDAKNHLVADDQWPAELAGFHRHKFEDEHCCLAYHKTPGPPPECAKWMDYDHQGAHWTGLMGADGKKIDLKAIPPHTWLLVDYAATWCAACVVQDRQLTRVFASERNASDFVWLTIDMTRVTAVKDAIKKEGINAEM